MPSNFYCILFLTIVDTFRDFSLMDTSMKITEKVVDKIINLCFEDLLPECKNTMSSCQESPLNATSSKRGHTLSQYQPTLRLRDVLKPNLSVGASGQKEHYTVVVNQICCLAVLLFTCSTTCLTLPVLPSQPNLPVIHG